MQDYIDELHEDADRIIKRMNTAAHDLALIGSEIERFEIFEKFRELIAQKELDGDVIAVEVLAWAYDQLAEL